MPSTSEYLLSLEAKYVKTIDTLAADLFGAWRDAHDVGDVKVVETVLDELADSAARRTSMMTDMVSWGAYQAGKIDEFDSRGSTFRWVLDGGAEHCATCLTYAGGGPYTIDTLPGIPGDAGTDCNGGCRCDLEEIKG